MTEIEFSEPLPDRLEALADSLRGEWPPHTLGDLQEAAYLLRKHGLLSLRSGNGGEVRKALEEFEGYNKHGGVDDTLTAARLLAKAVRSTLDIKP